MGTVTGQMATINSAPHSCLPAQCQAWEPLLRACDAYAKESGWRYSHSDLMSLRGDDSTHDRVRIQAMPVALDLIEDLQHSFSTSEQSPLRQGFEEAEKLVNAEAVYNSMLATCKALEVDAPSCPQSAGCTCDNLDLSLPFESIAQRLYCQERARLADPQARQKDVRRLGQASFIVDFGLAHGLPSGADPQAERLIQEFLGRAKKWCREHGQQGACVRGVVLEQLKEREQLHQSASSWLQDNWKTVLLGAALAVAASSLVLGALNLATSHRGRAPDSAAKRGGS